MKAGDVVKMRRRMFWIAKNAPNLTYSESPGIIIEIGSYTNQTGPGKCLGDGLLRILHSGRICRVDKDHWEVVE